MAPGRLKKDSKIGQKIRKIVLAYSGGLDTSVALHWLKQTYGCEVVAFYADIGPTRLTAKEREVIREKALGAGACEVYIDDLRERFTRHYIFPMLRAGAVYEGAYLLGTSIARPLIASRQVQIARHEGADAVAHGATGKGNDQVRFEVTYQALSPDLRIISPWREWPLRSRRDLIEYAQKRRIPITATRAKPYSVDQNLFHTSYEGGLLEDPWREPPAEIYAQTTAPEKAPDQPAYVEVEYCQGNPVAVNGKKLSAVRLMEYLNALGAAHGVGRVDLVENRYVGIKSRGVYETPGGTILHTAHRAVESLTLDREVMHLQDRLSPIYAELIYYGYWFSPERRMLQVAFDEAQKDVEGFSRLKLYKGQCTVVGRKAKRSLYVPELATFEEDTVYSQSDAEGFIRLNALRLKVQALRHKGRLRAP